MLRVIEINNQYPLIKVYKSKIVTIIRFLDSLKEYAVPQGDLSIVFLGDEPLAKLHASFLNDPSVTDVITFIGDPLQNFGGEICISIDRALSQSKALGTSFEEELVLYIVHGWLHLSGLKDKTVSEIQEMRKAENHVMGMLKKEKCNLKIASFIKKN